MTTEQADLNLTSMHRYLTAKCKPINGISEHVQECVSLANIASLQFFEMTFNADLKRLGLI